MLILFLLLLWSLLGIKISLGNILNREANKLNRIIKQNLKKLRSKFLKFILLNKIQIAMLIVSNHKMIINLITTSKRTT